MSLTDPIADMLTRVRNAIRAKKEYVNIPASKLSQAILELFKKEGYIDNYRLIEQAPQNILRVYLKYDLNHKSSTIDLKRISRPGLRIYAKKHKIPWVLNGLGTAIISSSRGVITDKQAREMNIGGEVLLYIW